MQAVFMLRTYTYLKIRRKAAFCFPELDYRT